MCVFNDNLDISVASRTTPAAISSNVVRLSRAVRQDRNVVWVAVDPCSQPKPRFCAKICDVEFKMAAGEVMKANRMGENTINVCVCDLFSEGVRAIAGIVKLFTNYPYHLAMVSLWISDNVNRNSCIDLYRTLVLETIHKKHTHVNSVTKKTFCRLPI